MLKNKRFAFMLFVLSLTAITAVSSTFAWYQIQVNASATYEGTSVGNSTKFQIGLRSEVQLPNAATYNLTVDSTNPYIYWSDGDLGYDTLDYYLSSNGYATNYLSPVTSGPHSNGNDISLKSSPSYLLGVNDTQASKSWYVNVNFVFRIIRTSSSTSYDYGDIYLKDYSLDGTGNIKQTCRVFFKSSTINSLINFNSLSGGTTPVGALMDLNSDGYYDYTTTVDSNGNVVQNEYVYGYYSGTPTYASSVTTGTGSKTFTGSCFEADHKDGTYAASFTSLGADYIGTQGLTNKGTVLASITQTESVADLNMTIYLEGYDRAFSNVVSGQRFSLVLNFESD